MLVIDMKILKQDLKNNLIKVQVDNLDDLWILSRIIDPNDIVGAETTRITKKSEEQEGKRKKIFVKLLVEKIEFKKQGDSLRVLGTIEDSSNPDVPHGEYHTITLNPSDKIEISKDFQKWHLERLKDAQEASKRPKVLLCAADYGDAHFAVLREFGVEHTTELSKNMPGKKKEAKKEYDKSRADFMTELAKMLEEISQAQKIDTIVVGGMGFFNENFKKVIDKNPALKKKIALIKISSTGKTGITEIVKRGAVSKVMKGSRVQEETELVDKFFEHISKDDNLAVYGTGDVRKAVDFGAVDTLLVSDTLIGKYREGGNFEELDSMMQDAEKGKARIIIISDEHEAGEMFSKMEIAAILRFPIG